MHSAQIEHNNEREEHVIQILIDEDHKAGKKNRGGGER